MKALILILILQLSSDPTRAQLHRLDPHGKKGFDFSKVTSLRGHSECSTCHIETGTGLGLKSVPAQGCADCHSKSPHAGTLEHVGKISGGKPITCLSCHLPHRQHTQNDLGSMLKLTCTECHKW